MIFASDRGILWEAGRLGWHKEQQDTLAMSVDAYFQVTSYRPKRITLAEHLFLGSEPISARTMTENQRVNAERV